MIPYPIDQLALVGLLGKISTKDTPFVTYQSISLCHSLILTSSHTCHKILLGFLFYCLGPDIEAPAQEANKEKTVNPVSLFLGLHKSKMIVIKLSLLFMLDAFAGSFVLQSIMSGWFNVKYVLRNPTSHFS